MENKEIKVIKNTLFMFLRMFFVMFLTLYSTRLLLKILGFENYGIYDLIFGIVLLFNILTGSIATSLQRFYNVTQGDSFKQSYIYSVSLQIFVIVSLLVLGLGLFSAESIVYSLHIPQNKIYISVFFFKLCVLNLFFMILRLPYIALLISNEKMGLYALVSVIEAILKFIGIYVLTFWSGANDLLSIYGLILNIVTLVVTVLFVLACFIKIDMPNFYIKNDKQYYKDVLLFSGWSLFGGSAVLLSQQGLSILLNKFFGVLINASNAITQQVYSAVYQFVNSFQTAYSPYLMKTYADGDFEKLKKLIILFSKFSIFLYLLIAIPLFTFTEQILRIWLHDIPLHTVIFVRLTIVVVLLEVMSGPLWLTIQASGIIHRYQVVVSLIMILNLPIAYFCFIYLNNPVLAFVVKIFTALLAYVYRMYKVRDLNCLNLKNYSKAIIFRMVLLIFILSPLIYYLSLKDLNIFEIFLNIAAVMCFLIIMSYLLLVDKVEHQKMRALASKYLKRVKL